MKLRCPSCGASCSLDVLIAHDAARQAVMTALQLPAALGRSIVQYVALFRPAKRELSLDRVGVLLEEILGMINRGQIVRNGHTVQIPESVWPEAFAEILNGRERLRLPLKGHGYLEEILITKAAQWGVNSAAVRTDPTVAEARHPSSKTARGLLALEKLKNG